MNAFFFISDDERRNKWTPPVDVYRTRYGWLLKFELAGVRLEDVQLQVGNRSLTISGVRRDYMLEDGCSFYSMEISYNRFERTVDLPTDLHGGLMQLEYKDGILLVRIDLGKQATRPVAIDVDEESAGVEVPVKRAGGKKGNQ
jgi:HSP20 family protein